MRKNCSIDREILLKFKTEGREFAKNYWDLGFRNMQEKLENRLFVVFFFSISGQSVSESLEQESIASGLIFGLL